MHTKGGDARKQRWQMWPFLFLVLQATAWPKPVRILQEVVASPWRSWWSKNCPGGTGSAVIQKHPTDTQHTHLFKKPNKKKEKRQKNYCKEWQITISHHFPKSIWLFRLPLQWVMNGFHGNAGDRDCPPWRGCSSELWYRFKLWQ